MNTLTYLFLIAVVVSYATQFWLSQRQIEHIDQHRNLVPVAFKDTISLDAHHKAAEYTIEKTQFSKISVAAGSLLLLIFTLGGCIDLVAGLWSSVELPPFIVGTGVILTIFFISYLTELPLDIYQTFSIETKYGFNRTTAKQFLIDQILQLTLGFIIGVPLLMLLLWIMQNVGPFWWLPAWAILITFSLIMSWAYPTFIAPLFNKFTPLDNAALKTRIESLLQRCGFSSNGIFVMDGSRRSGHGNAYFTGFGSNKRIVFFDTLIETLDPDEIEAVLAHELGHFKRKHVIKMLIAGAVYSLFGFALLGWLTGQSWFYSGLGVFHPSNAVALLLFILVSPVFTVFFKPIRSYVQRKHEFEADDFASDFAKPSALVSALVKLYRDNASTLTPDPMYTAFHYSHPPAALRIANLSGKHLNQQNS